MLDWLIIAKIKYGFFVDYNNRFKQKKVDIYCRYS